MEKIIFGIDYSYTNPSICVLGNSFKESYFYFLTTKKKYAKKEKNYEGMFLERKSGDNDIEFYEKISSWAISKIKENWINPNNTIVVLEGYSMGSRLGRSFNIAENTSILKFFLKQNNIKPLIVPPTTIKKFWTGKGNSSKDLMVKILLDKEGVDVLQWLGMKKLESPAHDLVDSYAIAKFGQEILTSIKRV